MPRTALGFRVKSGWAAAVVLSDPLSSPSVLHSRRIELSDSEVPESRQPFHAVDDTLGDSEPDQNQIEKRLELVRSVTKGSIAKLWADTVTHGWTPVRAGMVTGSLVDPATIRQPHIRAHAMEGRLFRTVVEDALRAYDMKCVVLAEKSAFEKASRVIHLDERELKRTVADLGRRVEGRWKSEEKLAALAAWVALSLE
jgi:hypothetical protein